MCGPVRGCADPSVAQGGELGAQARDLALERSDACDEFATLCRLRRAGIRGGRRLLVAAQPLLEAILLLAGPARKAGRELAVAQPVEHVLDGGEVGERMDPFGAALE